MNLSPRVPGRCPTYVLVLQASNSQLPSLATLPTLQAPSFQEHPMLHVNGERTCEVHQRYCADTNEPEL
eukprot:7284134-Prymnesium_polylepis.1